MHYPYRPQRQIAAQMATAGYSQQQIRRVLMLEWFLDWPTADSLASEACRVYSFDHIASPPRDVAS